MLNLHMRKRKLKPEKHYQQKMYFTIYYHFVNENP